MSFRYLSKKNLGKIGKKPSKFVEKAGVKTGSKNPWTTKGHTSGDGEGEKLFGGPFASDANLLKIQRQPPRGCSYKTPHREINP